GPHSFPSRPYGKAARRTRLSGLSGRLDLGPCRCSSAAGLHSRPQLLDIANCRPLLERGGHAALLPSYCFELDRLAIGDGKTVARLDVEVVAPEIRKDPIAMTLQFDGHLQGVIARGDRPAEDGYLFLCGQRARLVLLVVLDGPVQDEQRLGQAEGGAHVIAEGDLRTGPTNSTR